ncbi:hypothetical protein XELAEV_18008846mg [Xenopus laevis]|uniref:Uncharacterized protein n=1 Tax=Xenopus laevis TaxID=8355 RepID=A0A974DRL8_XENLA|nr:hypothetical protein XELAEV_18008846mg [Xenopus laevis]
MKGSSTRGRANNPYSSLFSESRVCVPAPRYLLLRKKKKRFERKGSGALIAANHKTPVESCSQWEKRCYSYKNEGGQMAANKKVNPATVS